MDGGRCVPVYRHDRGYARLCGRRLSRQAAEHGETIGFLPADHRRTYTDKQKELVSLLDTYLEERGFSVGSIDAGLSLQENSSQGDHDPGQLFAGHGTADRICRQHRSDRHDGDECP